MKRVTVARHVLLENLKVNREGHRQLFLKAQEGYKQAVYIALEHALEDARTGKAYRTYIALVEPQDHTEDYDTIVAMLEMSVEPNIEVEHHEFQQYVLDKWDWAAHAFFVNSTYSQGGSVAPDAILGKRQR